MVNFKSKDRKVSIKDAAFYYGKNMYVAGKSVASGPAELTPREKFMIALQADGSIHWEYSGSNERSLLFSFKKKRKLDEFISMVESTGYPWSEIKVGVNRKMCSML